MTNNFVYEDSFFFFFFFFSKYENYIISDFGFNGIYLAKLTKPMGIGASRKLAVQNQHMQVVNA